MTYLVLGQTEKYIHTHLLGVPPNLWFTYVC